MVEWCEEFYLNSISFIYVCVFLSVPMSRCQKRVLDRLELELQVFIGCLTRNLLDIRRDLNSGPHDCASSAPNH